MKITLVLACLLCSAGISIYMGIKKGYESAITKYYLYSPSKGKEEVTFEYYNSVESYRRKMFGSEVVFNLETAYTSGLETFAGLLVMTGTIIFLGYAFTVYKQKKKIESNSKQ